MAFATLGCTIKTIFNGSPWGTIPESACFVGVHRDYDGHV